MDVIEVKSEIEMERLNAAILKAIQESAEVKRAVRALKKKNLVDDWAAVNLVLSLEELESCMESQPLPLRH